MIKFFSCLVVLTTGLLTASAQSAAPATAGAMPFGKIDKADLELTSCAFEKDANAEVLFDKGDVYFDLAFNIVMERHTRIKIFNDKAKDQANVRLEYYGGNRLEQIYDIQAETINEVDGKPETTKLDKKQLFFQIIDKQRNAAVFSLPNVKAGSIIEYKYKETLGDVPDWFFQHNIPIRYSEYSTDIPEMLYYKTQIRVRDPFVINSRKSQGRSSGTGDSQLTYNEETSVRAMANIHSLPDEPYMSSSADNLQCILFELTAITPIRGFTKTFIDSWPKVGGHLAEDEDFGGQLKRKLNNEEVIIDKAKALKNDDDKIAYIFNTVRDQMKWDGIDRWYTNDGTYRAWEKKTGNSTEVNLILYHLLKQSGVKAFPMVVSTRKHGKVNPAYPFLYQFNRTVVYIPVDSTKNYILDATGKYNMYNEIPDNLLNSSGLYIDKENKSYDMVFIKKEQPARQVILISADIKPGGKINGTVQIYSYSYNRIKAIRQYKTDGEKKYIDYLTDNDNNLKISNLKFESMDVDTLPLKQKIDFNLDLTGSDDNYIYLNPNIFTSLKDNVFLSENRFSDIDFGYRNNFTINEIYRLPAGYKTDALPKNVSLVMPDKSITFKRVVVEQDGSILIRYNIDYKKTIYFKEDYQNIREFYKQMYEMLNEQIVLKKS